MPVVGAAPGNLNRRGIAPHVGSIRDAMLVNLRDYGVPVTNLHAAVVCAEACRVVFPSVPWIGAAFAPAAADCLQGMLDAAEAERRDVAVATFAATEGAKVIAELRHHDRSRSGRCSRRRSRRLTRTSTRSTATSFKSVLLALARRREITPPMRAAMSMSMRCVDVDGDGVVRYGELVDFFCDVMGHMERGARVRAALRRPSGARPRARRPSREGSRG